MGRTVRSAIGGVLLLLAVVPASRGAGDVAVRLELSQQFYYEGDPLDVRISVHNQTDKKLKNPLKTALFDGFKVRREGKVLEPGGRSSAGQPSRPEQLAGESFYGATINLLELYPGLASRGVYEIFWSGDGILSDMLVVTIVPRYDPAKKYRGEIETEFGSITINLLGEESPIAVKSFIDLANSGFYNGLEITEIRPDDFLVGGDPRFGDGPRPPIQFPAEQSGIPLVTGTVVLRPVRATPPANGPSFVIMLRPQPEWSGQVTVLGQVVKGLDIVQKISRLPSSMRNSQPNFKPLKQVTIKAVTIHEQARTGAPS